MRLTSFYPFLFTLCIISSACNDDEKGTPCVKLNEDNSTLMIVNGSSHDSLCHEVSEGFELFINWPFDQGIGSEKWKFAFEGTQGFDIKQGSADGRDEPNITLIARADSPANATIKVYAYNDCSESNRATTKIKVYKDLPYSIDPRSSLPQNIASAVTFTYQGKGYVMGGERTSSTGNPNDNTWVFDPSNDSFEELPSVLQGDEQSSAAVVGDTAFILQDSGKTLLAYHIPSNTIVREINTGIATTEPYPTGHRLFCFAIGNKVYFGPTAFLISQLISYDVATGIFSSVPLPHLSGDICKAAFLFDNVIYFITEAGEAHFVNLTTGERSFFLFPFTSNDDEKLVSFFSANGKAYFATTEHYYRFYPLGSWANVEMFNGNDCNPMGWTGHKLNVSNFVLDDRVYFLGGQDTEGGPLNDYFQGVRF